NEGWLLAFKRGWGYSSYPSRAEESSTGLRGFQSHVGRTADVHADRGRNDRALGRNHRAHRGTLAEMHVRHDRDVTGKDRQLGDVAQLLDRVPIDLDARGP